MKGENYMDTLTVKEDFRLKDGRVLLKNNTAYLPKGTDIVNGKKYLVYDTEIEGQEYLVLINK